jgi:hypothetical protein
VRASPSKSWTGRAVSDAVLATLADYGALGIMVLFLIWQHLGMQKRLDGLVD